MNPGTIERFVRRIQNVIGRGQIKTIDDTGPVQLLQVNLGPKETRDKTMRVSDFGFASAPPVDAHAVLVFIAGDRSNGVVIGTNWRDRLKNLKPGESALYDAWGRFFRFTKDGAVILDANGTEVQVNNATKVTINASAEMDLTTPLVKISQDLQVAGDIHASGNVSDAHASMAADRAIYNTHTHPAGSPNTGAPNQPQ